MSLFAFWSSNFCLLFSLPSYSVTLCRESRTSGVYQNAGRNVSLRHGAEGLQQMHAHLLRINSGPSGSCQAVAQIQLQTGRARYQRTNVSDPHVSSAMVHIGVFETLTLKVVFLSRSSVYHSTAAKGQLKCLKLLCEKDATIWLRNRKGDYPIHEAYYNKQTGRHNSFVVHFSIDFC